MWISVPVLFVNNLKLVSKCLGKVNAIFNRQYFEATHILMQSLNKQTLDLISCPKQMMGQMCSSNMGIVLSDRDMHKKEEVQIL